MKKLLMVGALVMSTGAVAGNQRLDCTFKNSDSDEIMEFSYQSVDKTWFMLGGNGTVEVQAWVNNDRVSFRENIPSGNETLTTMFRIEGVKVMDAVHSRHMWLSGPIFSQFRGTCTWSNV